METQTSEKNHVLNYMKKQVVDELVLISVKENKDFDSKKATEYFANNAKAKFSNIWQETIKDSKEANNAFMSQSMMLEAGKISLLHGLTLFAKEIFEHSKIE
jgi:CRISPR/Cas system-associated endonuclease Cas1